MKTPSNITEDISRYPAREEKQALRTARKGGRHAFDEEELLRDQQRTGSAPHRPSLPEMGKILKQR